MRKLTLLIGTVAIAAGLGSAPSWATSGIVDDIAYVDPEFGSDSASCGGDDLWGASSPVQGTYQATGPCQTLNQALNNLGTNGGTVQITRPGVFGPIVLTASTNILGPESPPAQIDWKPGVVPGCNGFLPGSGNCNSNADATYAVDIQVGTGNSVKFKNVLINGNGSTTNGNPTAALHLGSAGFVSLTGTALRAGSCSGTVPEMMLVDSSQGSQMQIYMHNADVAFSCNGGAIVLEPTGATPIRMDFNGSEVHNATFGLQSIATGLTGTANIQIIVADTEFFSFSNSAISIVAPNASNTDAFLVVRSEIVNTGGAGIKLNGAGAESAIYEAAILGNATGVNIVNTGETGGMATYSNNAIIGNGVECEVNSVNTPCSSALSPQSPD
jgi:hypothetical protein